jgi:ABC-type branched-subunit amino acid transport system ATPase component
MDRGVSNPFVGAAGAAAPGVVGGGAVVAARDLRVRFGGLLAVRDVSFSLGGGTLLGLIGPNGAGKTTLLRTVAV